MFSPLTAVFSAFAKNFLSGRQDLSISAALPRPVGSASPVPRPPSQGTSLETIAALDWQEFELFVGQVYRRGGYQVEQRGGRNPDGGIDLVLRSEQGRLLVQCKHWKAYQVGVRQARELYGVLAAEDASGAVLVTGGRFTQEARAFAAGKPLLLVDGPAFVAQANKAQAGLEIGLLDEVREARKTRVPACPTCSRPMLKRTARSGANAGNEFWGCPAYPKCRGTRQV